MTSTEFVNSINALAAEIYEGNKRRGFWDDGRGFPEVIALIHSELSEALEENRSGHLPCEVYYNDNKPGKPEGVGVELADAIIRILDYCGSEDINIGSLVHQKLQYNESRPYKHGRKF